MKISYQILAATSTILSIKYIKNFLRISHDYDDELLMNLQGAAISYAEQVLGIKIQKRAVKALINNTKETIVLRHGRITEMKSVNLLENGQKTDITKDFGEVNEQFNKIKLQAKYLGKSIEIKYVVGYTKQNIPHDIMHGLMVHIAKMYEQSENTTLVNEQVKELYKSHRIIKI